VPGTGERKAPAVAAAARALLVGYGYSVQRGVDSRGERCVMGERWGSGGGRGGRSSARPHPHR